jgi:hypothetical protein
VSDIAVYKSGSFSHFLKRSKCLLAIARGKYKLRTDGRGVDEVEIDHRQVVMAGAGLSDGPMGTGNVLPFFKIPSRFTKPEKHHYPIPAVGARSRPQHNYQINFVPEAP